MSLTANLVVGGGLIASASAAATVTTSWWNTRQSRRRSEWRNEDRIDGWMGDDGIWRPGAVDLVLGYGDRDGRFHKGLNTRVDSLEELAHDHPSGNSGSRPRSRATG